MNNVFLFRHDLRLQDHSALNEALELSDFISFAIKKPNDFGKWGLWRQKFWLESIQELKDQLEKNGHDLFMVSVEEKFEDFDHVFLTKEHSYDEILEENSLQKVVAIESNELYQNLDVTELPTQFTPFRKYVEKNHFPVPTFDPPDFYAAGASQRLQGQSLKWPETSSREQHPETGFPFFGGEIAGHKRLREYFFETKNVLEYKNTRNEMYGTEGSTKFSAWLALGALSPRQIYSELKRFENLERSNESTYWVFFELLWREFFRWMCQRYGKSFFELGGTQGKIPNFTHDEQKIELWKSGQTGEPIVDACMRELVQTGYLSNRGRQIAASFFVNELNQDWRVGAQFYEHHLIDYDVYSNWGNWLYLAGVGFDPRGKRWFDPKKQAERYDPHHQFRQLWLS